MIIIIITVCGDNCKKFGIVRSVNKSKLVNNDQEISKTITKGDHIDLFDVRRNNPHILDQFAGAMRNIANSCAEALKRTIADNSLHRSRK